jgi:hypothetical protein
MRAAIAFVLSFIASTLAYQILTPNNVTGWTSTGGQTFTWSTVNSDQPTFSVVLSNQNPNSGIAADYSQNLLPSVTGSDLSAVVSPPAGGFQVAIGYRLNFMAIPSEANSNSNGILAQSDEFAITDGSSSISASGTTGTSSPSTETPLTQTGTAVIYGSSGTSDSSGTSASVTPTSSSTSGAASTYFVQTGFLVLFSLLGFTLA